MTHPNSATGPDPDLDPAAVRDRIAALTDEHTVTTLALVLQHQGHPIDPFTQDQQQAHLREALTQPDITTAIAPIPDTSDGDLARTALTHLADTDPATAALVNRAIQIAPGAERDPTLMLAVGALVLFAFHADIDLTRDPKKGWTLRFHTKGLSDSTIGKLLGQLLGNYLNPK